MDQQIGLPWMIANSIHVLSSSPRTGVLGHSQLSLRGWSRWIILPRTMQICGGSTHPSATTLHESADPPFVIPTGAKRSGGTCGSLFFFIPRRLGAPWRRFPAEACGADTLQAPFLNERRTRGLLLHSVAGNRGQAVLWLEWITQPSTRLFCH
jgi:hypothetical protein